MSDLPTKVAKIEVKIEKLEKLTDSLEKEMDEITKELIIGGKDLIGVIKQFKGIMTQFSKFSVRLQELEEEVQLVHTIIENHISDFTTFKDNLGLFKFIKNNKENIFYVIILFIIIVYGFNMLSDPSKFISSLTKLSRLLGF